jgi:hypothetical protein
MSEPKEHSELEALKTIISSLSPFERDAQIRLLAAATTFLNLRGVTFPSTVESRNMWEDFFPSPTHTTAPQPSNSDANRPKFSDRPDLSPKQFLMDKEPRTDVERAATLAFYLTHYRNKPEFKTLDISKLNTEAAQNKFSNAAVTVENATKLGFLVPATKGLKQLGAMGERFVQALPDRDAAKAVRAKVRPRRAKKGQKIVSPPSSKGEDS